MPAASAEKKARQRANKILQTESAATPTVSATANESPVWPTPAPISFTISYTPIAISYPEPVNSTAPLPSDAIRVTRDQLADMLHQSYIHGSEHGWKIHFASSNELLRAGYEQDMQAAAATFAEHEKLIKEEAFDCSFEYGTDRSDAQLASLQESLTAKYDMQHLATLTNMSERCQEFNEAGIRDERERWESARASQVNFATQTDPTTVTSTVSVQTDCLVTSLPSTATVSVQTNTVKIHSSSSVSISTQTEPPIPTVSKSIPIPIPISEPPIPDTTSSAPFNWADDTLSLSTIHLIISKQPRDLSSLCSSSKNPFSSLCRRHHYSKHQKKSIFVSKYPVSPNLSTFSSFPTPHQSRLAP